MHHRLLSKDLEEILREENAPDGITLNELMRRTEGRGIYIAMMLLCLPTLTPIPLPVINNLVGFAVGLMALQLAVGRPPRLPRFLGDHQMTPAHWQKILRASVRIVRWIEKFARPRKTEWLAWRAARMTHALFIAALALLLALPIAFPFANSLPSLAIILIAVSQMEEDGYLIWAGYAATAGVVAYYLAFFELILVAAQKGWGLLLKFWEYIASA
jgi:hypothetical protein